MGFLNHQQQDGPMGWAFLVNKHLLTAQAMRQQIASEVPGNHGNPRGEIDWPKSSGVINHHLSSTILFFKGRLINFLGEKRGIGLGTVSLDFTGFSWDVLIFLRVFSPSLRVVMESRILSLSIKFASPLRSVPGIDRQVQVVKY